MRPLHPGVGTPQLPSFDPEGSALVETSSLAQEADEELLIDPQLPQDAGTIGDTLADADETPVDTGDTLVDVDDSELPSHRAIITSILCTDAISTEEGVPLDSDIVSDFVATTIDLALTLIEDKWISKPKLSPAQFDGPADGLWLHAEQFVQFLVS